MAAHFIYDGYVDEGLSIVMNGRMGSDHAKQLVRLKIHTRNSRILGLEFTFLQENWRLRKGVRGPDSADS